ncbi:MAG: hypothetical protein OHK0053_02820 [Microscillaceae bacterium]
MSTETSAVKEYSNGEITIVWKANLCIHSANCVKGLPQVFDTQQKPWINAQRASSAEMMAQVQKCPSGALTYYVNAAPEGEAEVSAPAAMVAEVIADGPLKVEGRVQIKMIDGALVEKETRAFFCRCGASENKPFCDGAHKKIGFKG